MSTLTAHGVQADPIGGQRPMLVVCDNQGTTSTLELMALCEDRRLSLLVFETRYESPEDENVPKKHSSHWQGQGDRKIREPRIHGS